MPIRDALWMSHPPFTPALHTRPSHPPFTPALPPFVLSFTGSFFLRFSSHEDNQSSSYPLSYLSPDPSFCALSWRERALSSSRGNGLRLDRPIRCATPSSQALRLKGSAGPNLSHRLQRRPWIECSKISSLLRERPLQRERVLRRTRRKETRLGRLRWTRLAR